MNVENAILKGSRTRPIIVHASVYLCGIGVQGAVRVLDEIGPQLVVGCCYGFILVPASMARVR